LLSAGAPDRPAHNNDSGVIMIRKVSGFHAVSLGAALFATGARRL
jgi:hypothetical protein